MFREISLISEIPIQTYQPKGKGVVSIDLNSDISNPCSNLPTKRIEREEVMRYTKFKIFLVVIMLALGLMLGSGTAGATALVETGDSFLGQPTGLFVTFNAPVMVGSNTYSGSIGDTGANRDRTDNLTFTLPAGSRAIAGFYTNIADGARGISFFSATVGGVVGQGGTLNFSAGQLAAINAAGSWNVIPLDFQGGVAGVPNTYIIGLTVAVQVDIDIKPGSEPSSFGCDSKDSLPVAVLGSATFDATAIDADTVRFGRVGDEAAEVHEKNGSPKRHVEDFNKDGFLDMIFHFSLPDTDFSCSDIQTGDKSADVTGNLTGKLGDETDIVGQGTLRLVVK